MTAITLDLHSIVEMTLEQFYQRTRSRIMALFILNQEGEVI